MSLVEMYLVERSLVEKSKDETSLVEMSLDETSQSIFQFRKHFWNFFESFD